MVASTDVLAEAYKKAKEVVDAGGTNTPGRVKDVENDLGLQIKETGRRQVDDTTFFSSQQGSGPYEYGKWLLCRERIENMRGEEINAKNGNGWRSSVVNRVGLEVWYFGVPGGGCGEGGLCFLNQLAFSKIMKKYDKVKLRIAHLSSHTMAYMEVLKVDAFIISKRFVSVSITHRVTTKQVAVAGSSSKAVSSLMELWLGGSDECMTARDVEVQHAYPTSFELEDKGIDIMKDKVSQEEEEVPLNNYIGKQIGDFIDMPSEAVEQRIDVNVPDEIDGAKGEQVPNHVVKKGNLEFLVFKEIANPGVNELVDKGRPLKRKKGYAE
ncbi:shikimate O-hydroxycinnamoyltransferase [Tanacetum coccineum]